MLFVHEKRASETQGEGNKKSIMLDLDFTDWLLIGSVAVTLVGAFASVFGVLSWLRYVREMNERVDRLTQNVRLEWTGHIVDLERRHFETRYGKSRRKTVENYKFAGIVAFPTRYFRIIEMDAPKDLDKEAVDQGNAILQEKGILDSWLHHDELTFKSAKFHKVVCTKEEYDEINGVPIQVKMTVYPFRSPHPSIKNVQYKDAIQRSDSAKY